MGIDYLAFLTGLALSICFSFLEVQNLDPGFVNYPAYLIISGMLQTGIIFLFGTLAVMLGKGSVWGEPNPKFLGMAYFILFNILAWGIDKVSYQKALVWDGKSAFFG